MRSSTIPSSSTATCSRRSTRATGPCGSSAPGSGWRTEAPGSTASRRRSASTPTRCCARPATRRTKSSACGATESSETLDLVGGDGAVKALELERTDLFGVHEWGHRGMDALADEDLVARGLGAQAEGEVGNAPDRRVI